VAGIRQNEEQAHGPTGQALKVFLYTFAKCKGKHLQKERRIFMLQAIITGAVVSQGFDGASAINVSDSGKHD